MNYPVLTLTIVLCLALRTSCNQSPTGIYFLYENAAYASYSSWVLTYTIDLKPYRTHLRETLLEIKEFQEAIQTLNEQVPSYVNESHRNIFQYVRREMVNLLKQESNQFIQEYETIGTLFDEIGVLTSKYNTRQKRSIMPIVGNLLNFLFATATQHNVNELRKIIINVGSRQEQLVDIVGESVTLLNKTNAHVQINRNAIEKLSNVTTTLHEQLMYLYDEISLVMFPESTYTMLVSRLQAIFNVVTATIRQIHLNILDLLSQVHLSIQGQLSPILISPTELIGILKQINSQISEKYNLPFPLTEDGLLMYYKFIHPSVVPIQDGFHIVMALPLLHADKQFDIYRAIQVPIPDGQLQLGATYLLESEYFAVSKDENHFAFLQSEELSPCISSPACKFTSPWYSVISYPTCLLSLFLRNKQRIDQYCHKKISNFPPVPVIKYLFEGFWLISTAFKFNLSINCPSNTRQVEISNVHLIPVENNCSVISKYFKFPTRMVGSSSEKQQIKFNAELSLAKLTPNIWNNDKDSPFNHTYETILSELPKVENIPLDHFKQILSTLNKPIEKPRKFSNHISTVIIIFLVLNVLILGGVGLFVTLICYRKHRNKSQSLPVIRVQRKRRRSVNEPQGESDLEPQAKLVVSG